MRFFRRRGTARVPERAEQSVAEAVELKLHDSALIQAEMIAQQMPTVRMPKDTLLSESSGGGGRLAFIGGESLGTTFAGESLAENATSWRRILARGDLPVSRYTVVRATYLKSAGKFADSAGYPVAIRRSRGARSHMIPAPAVDNAQLVRQMRALQEIDERMFVVIEEARGAVLLDCLVVGEEVLSVLDVSSGIESPREVGQGVHPELLELAVAGLGTLPGIEHGSVTLRVDDLQAPARNQSAHIVDIDANPRLSRRVQAGARADVVGGFLAQHRNQGRVERKDRKEIVDAKITVTGVPLAGDRPIALDSLLKELRLRLDGEPRPKGQGSDWVMQVEGSPEAIAALTVRLIEGEWGDRPAHMVMTAPAA